MSNLIQIQKGCKSFGLKDLFVDATFAINAGEHVGVIGPNGAGKTTLFRILTEQDQLDSGLLVKANNLRLGYLAQHDHWQPGETVEDYLSNGCITPIWELKAMGNGLGLHEDIYAQAITSLSGGYRMRCKLLHLLGEEPDLLLLDEPTNYLDLESVMVLETFLQSYKGAFLLISHDREFLRRTTDHILEVEGGDIIKYNGNLEDYFEQKELLRRQLEARALSLSEKKKQIMEFVDRFRAKASKARQAQSKLKSVQKMETIEVKPLPITARIQIPSPRHTGKQVLRLKDVDLGYGTHIVLQGIDFQIRRGDHLAVVGVNGAGKTTFLKALAGELKPLKGQVEWGYEVSIGYYAQHVTEALNPKHNVLESLQSKAHPDVLPQEVLNMAGSLLFSQDDLHKKISILSGGEKSRVALGQILLEKSPCLVLDEPTNHLDFQTVEALTLALSDYPGTVIIVSHDRSFTRRLGKQILEIKDGRAELYPGTYEEYIWSLQKGSLANRTHSPQQNHSSTSLKNNEIQGAASSSKSLTKDLRKQIQKMEKKATQLDVAINSCQKQMQVLNTLLSQSPQDPKAQDWIQQLGETQTQLEKLEAQWMELHEKIEQLQS